MIRAGREGREVVTATMETGRVEEEELVLSAWERA